MHQSGELVEELEKIGIKSALVTEGEENEDNDKKKEKGTVTLCTLLS